MRGWCWQGDLDGARTRHQQALRIMLAALGPEHSRVVAIRQNLDAVATESEAQRRVRPPATPDGGRAGEAD